MDLIHGLQLTYVFAYFHTLSIPFVDHVSQHSLGLLNTFANSYLHVIGWTMVRKSHLINRIRLIQEIGCKRQSIGRGDDAGRGICLHLLHDLGYLIGE